MSHPGLFQPALCPYQLLIAGGSDFFSQILCWAETSDAADGCNLRGGYGMGRIASSCITHAESFPHDNVAAVFGAMNFPDAIQLLLLDVPLIEPFCIQSAQIFIS